MYDRVKRPSLFARWFVALGALVAVGVVAGLLVAANDDTLETAGVARSVGEPAGQSEGAAKALGAPEDFDAQGLPDAPAALGFIDRNGRSVVEPGTAPQAPSFGEAADGSADSPEGTEEQDPALALDDPPDGPAPTTTTPSSTPATTPSSTTATSTTASSAPTTSAVQTPGTVATTAAPRTTAAPATTAAALAPTTTATPTTTAPETTAPETTVAPAAAPTTAAPTTTGAPAPRPVGTKGAAGYIAPSAGTYIPVYDTAWQMLVRSTPAQADNYFAALKANGFSGTWTGVIHHAPATYNSNYAGGGLVGRLENGNVVLTDGYIAHVRQILDAADRHGMKVGLVAAWQNLYLPGGGADSGVSSSNAVRGTITTANSYAYGRQIADKFGDHPAVSMWVFGGDAGTNNTEANKAVWREMARGVRDTGNGLSITYHTPTSEFDQLNYAGEPWLDFIAPETGHAQDAGTTEQELRTARSAYGLPVWQGEPRYFNINFDWVNAAFRDPGVSEVRADAQAAENAGVSGYVYGDAGRWTWCAGFGDSSPCDPNNVAGSFGAGEQAVIEVFRG